MMRAHILWIIGAFITRAGDHAARAHTARQDHAYGGTHWTGR